MTAPSIKFAPPQIGYIMTADEPPKFTVRIDTNEGIFTATAATIPLALVIASADWWQAVAVAGGIAKR